MHRAFGLSGIPFKDGDVVADAKKRLWKGVFYEDSAPEDWREVIEEWGVPVLVSPLHDRDFDKDGVLKKPHRHFLMEFDGPVTYSYALGIASELGCKILKDCRSKRRDEQYWCHLNSPNKTKYDVADLECFGGYEVKYIGDEQGLSDIREIQDLAEELGIIYYADLANEIIERRPELMATFLHYPAHFNNFCYSRERLAGKYDNASYVKSRRRVGRYASDV